MHLLLLVFQEDRQEVIAKVAVHVLRRSTQETFQGYTELGDKESQGPCLYDRKSRNRNAFAGKIMEESGRKSKSSQREREKQVASGSTP